MKQSKTWECFHCGFVAENEVEAREHFGPNAWHPPACEPDPTYFAFANKLVDEWGATGKYPEDLDPNDLLIRIAAALGGTGAAAYEDGYKTGLEKGMLEYSGAMADLESVLKVLIARINGEKDLASAARWVQLNYPKEALGITVSRETSEPDK